MDIATKQEEGDLKMWTILKMFLPLLAVRLVQRCTRPVINVFVSRQRPPGTDESYSVEQLAVLAICFSVPRVPYSWLNELKALEPTFGKKDENGHREVSIKNIRIFGVCCTLFSASMQLILFWIPDILLPLVIKVSNVSEDVALLTVTPLKISVIFSFTAGFRDLLTGWVYKKRKNHLLYPGIVIRTITLIVVVVSYPKLGLYGATMGISALATTIFSGSFTLVIICLYVGRKEKLKKRKECLVDEEGELSNGNSLEKTKNEEIELL